MTLRLRREMWPRLFLRLSGPLRFARTLSLKSAFRAKTQRTAKTQRKSALHVANRFRGVEPRRANYRVEAAYGSYNQPGNYGCNCKQGLKLKTNPCLREIRKRYPARKKPRSPTQ